MESMQYALTERKLWRLLTTCFLLYDNWHFNHIHILMISILILYIAAFLKACCIWTLAIFKMATANFHLTHLMTSQQKKYFINVQLGKLCCFRNFL